MEEGIAPHEAVDGGVWAICPALAALGEAVGVLKIPLERIDMLSVGTAGFPTLIDDPSVQGKLGWATRAPNLLMNAQLDATLLYMKQLLGDRFVRVDDHRASVSDVDKVESLDPLIGRGVQVGQERSGTVLSRFVNGVKVAP